MSFEKRVVVWGDKFYAVLDFGDDPEDRANGEYWNGPFESKREAEDYLREVLKEKN